MVWAGRVARGACCCRALFAHAVAFAPCFVTMSFAARGLPDALKNGTRRRFFLHVRRARAKGSRGVGGGPAALGAPGLIWRRSRLYADGGEEKKPIF